MADVEALSDDDLREIEAGLADLSQGFLSFSKPKEIRATLQETWGWGTGFVAEEAGEYLPASSWLVAWTVAFRKAIEAIDRTLQGKILSVIMEITRDPLKLKGDTMKPLSGDMKGLWRYRIGDYRLVYKADEKTHQIALLTFGPRGGVYD